MLTGNGILNINRLTIDEYNVCMNALKQHKEQKMTRVEAIGKVLSEYKRSFIKKSSFTFIESECSLFVDALEALGLLKFDETINYFGGACDAGPRLGDTPNAPRPTLTEDVAVKFLKERGYAVFKSFADAIDEFRKNNYRVYVRPESEFKEERLGD